MVLIVVLSVHNGFERNLKEMMLGFSPHVTVQSSRGRVTLWEEMEAKLAERPEVESAYALIEDFVLLDSKRWRKPAPFRAINTADEAQIQALRDLLDPDFPESQADMGEDNFAVVSRQLALAMDLQIGDEIRLLAARNLDQVLAAYDVPEERAVEAYAEDFGKIRGVIEEMGEGGVMAARISEAEALLKGFFRGPEGEESEKETRAFEREILDGMLYTLEEPSEVRDGRYFYEEGTREALLGSLETLETYDMKEVDNDAFKNLEEIVKPKTMVVYGVYADTQRSQGPALFIPLSIGQELKGLQGEVEKVGVRLADPYKAEEASRKMQADLGTEWLSQSWMVSYAGQFQLVKTEKIMMSFALSFITLLSAFSIMAVMYTVTVQKRQEIGVMKALGARPSQIMRVFLYQGVIVGIGGAILGLGLGLLAVHNREHIVTALRSVKVDPFPPNFHGMSELPAEIVSDQLVVICLVAVVLCILAALVPAIMAAFRDPAKSLRNL